MKVAVTGAGGLLGSALVPLWREAGAAVTAWSHRDLDVTDARGVARAVADLGPDVVVHAAAWTNVDGAEADPDGALRVNRDGTAAVAAACAATGARMVALSSDYVFDGTARAPIPAAAPLGPRGAYARSKAAGEAALSASQADWLLVRTGWVFGPGGRNFVDTMRTMAGAGRTADVVDDQRGAPTSARLLAEAIWALVTQGERGTWHVAAAGDTSWFGVALAVYEAAGAPVSLVRPTTTAATQARYPAPRPAYSVLDCSATVAALRAPLPSWRDQVQYYVRRGVLPPCGLMKVAA